MIPVAGEIPVEGAAGATATGVNAPDDPAAGDELPPKILLPRLASVDKMLPDPDAAAAAVGADGRIMVVAGAGVVALRVSR